MWNNFRVGLSTCRNKFIKLKSKNKERGKWTTKEVRSWRKAKKVAWNNYKASNKDKVLYKVYQNKLKKSVAENRRAKTKFEEQLALNIKNDTKSFFAHANSNRKTNRKIG